MIIPRWNAPDSVQAMSSTRQGGVSTGQYESLNLGMHVGDSSKSVQKNRDIVRDAACMPSEPVWLNQTHSTKIARIDQAIDVALDADGVFTETPGVVCSVMTADCLPVLLTNHTGTQVAAVHAGWRGLANGILEQCAELFSGEVIAWLGPVIGKTAFEVGDDVLEAFVSHDKSAVSAFQAHHEHPDKWFADLALLAELRLKHLGITSVYSSGLCTYSHPEQFFSYRRDGVTGRQASFIWFT